MEKCNYNFKKGWWCSLEVNHEGPCCLWQVRNLRFRLKAAWYELTRKDNFDSYYRR